MPLYSADEIEILPETEALRRRPSLYVGDLTDPEVLNCLVVETLCLAADALESGSASRVRVTLLEGGDVTVEDDGPGLDVEPYRGGPPFAEWVVSTLTACRLAKVHAEIGEKYCLDGIVVTNALSEVFELDFARTGDAWFLRYERGHRTAPLTRVGPAVRQGTRVRFRPDRDIFGDKQIDAAALGERLSALGLRGLEFVDAR